MLLPKHSLGRYLEDRVPGQMLEDLGTHTNSDVSDYVYVCNSRARVGLALSRVHSVLVQGVGHVGLMVLRYTRRLDFIT